MTPVGETLRRERLKRNLELPQISQELKISARLLQAMEDDQWEKLPGGIFAKGFVRQYASLLGLDAEDLAGQVQRILTPVAEIPQSEGKSKPTVAPIQVPKMDEWQTVGDKRFRWSGSLVSAVLVVVAMLVCSAVYAWLQRPKSLSTTAQASPPAQTSPVPIPPPVQPALTAAATTLEGSSAAPSQAAGQQPVETKPGEPKPVEPKPLDAKTLGARPAPAPVAKAATPNPDATVRVEITADETVWILARADGKYAFSATMDAHTSRTVEGVKDVVLRLGNAGAVTLSLNGKPIGPGGPKGQVRTIQFTSGGFQMVPGKLPSAPPDLIDRR
jgi:cytoskeleton protein RodZ